HLLSLPSPRSTPFPYTTLFRSDHQHRLGVGGYLRRRAARCPVGADHRRGQPRRVLVLAPAPTPAAHRHGVGALPSQVKSPLPERHTCPSPPSSSSASRISSSRRTAQLACTPTCSTSPRPTGAGWA